MPKYYGQDCKFEIKSQPKSNSLDHMINPTFRNIKRLFVFSFKNADNNPERGSYDKYYMPSLEIKDFNALIEKKPFFDQPVKKNKKHMKTLLKCQETMITQS